MQFILLTLACSFLPTYSAHVLSSRIFIRTIFIAQVKLDRFNRFVNNIVLKTCSPRGSSYAPFLPQQLEFFSSKRNISRFRIPSERGCNVVRGGRRKEEEGKGKEARTLESSLIKPLNFLLCHFFPPFPFLFFPPANVRDVFAWLIPATGFSFHLRIEKTVTALCFPEGVASRVIRLILPFHSPWLRLDTYLAPTSIHSLSVSRLNK